jgi:hypothetical protein
MNEIQKGEDSRKNWLQINANTREVARLANEARRLSDLVADLRRRVGDGDMERHAFRVYNRINCLLASPDADNWRKFQVQHGYVNMVKTTGCDDEDGEGTTPELIEVAAETAVYYIWVEVTLSGTTVTAAEVKHGATGWTGFPDEWSTSGKYFKLLARIDTDTWVEELQAVIRQFQDEDIWVPQAGGSGQSFLLKTVSDDYVEGVTWDGENEGEDLIKIAKPWMLRCSLASSSYMNETHNYTYAAGPDGLNLIRTDDDGTKSEQQMVTPAWRVDEVIKATSMAADIKVDAVRLSWVLDTSHRQWSRIDEMTSGD